MTRFRNFAFLSILMLAFFIVGFAFADDSVISPGDFLTQVFTAIKGFGGVPWVGKISVIVLLVIASFKVSFLNNLIWSKLGNFKAWAAPILGLVAGLLAMGGGLTLPGVFAYISAGAGAILLHELLDTVKAIPGLGAIYVEIINVVEGALGGGQATPVVPVK